jgi:hypothetical protein
MNIKGKVESCKLYKSGETNGINWSKYDVVINGQKFTSFRPLDVGSVVQLEYTEEKFKGKIYKTLVFPKKDPKKDKENDMLKDLVARVDALEDMVYGRTTGRTTQPIKEPIKEVELDVKEDLPF